MKRLSSVGGPRPALVSFSCQKSQKVVGLFCLNRPTREQGGVLHAVDDFFVGGAEGGQGAGKAGLAGHHEIIRAQAQAAVDFDGAHRGGRGLVAG
jgi:hypothetical protein